MNVNDLAQRLGDLCYLLLTINFFWGLYNIIMGFRRVRQLDFRNQFEQTEHVASVTESLRTENYDAVMKECTDDPRALCQLTSVAILNRRLRTEQLQQLLAELLQRDVLGDLEYRTTWVATVIKSGPLLGLFGTVLGMMAAFGRIGSGEKIQPSQIADEISIALICTAMGLATAIPFNFLLASLNTRIRRFQDGLSAGLMRLIETLKGLQK